MNACCAAQPPPLCVPTRRPCKGWTCLGAPRLRSAPCWRGRSATPGTASCCCQTCGWTGPTSWTACTPCLRVGGQGAGASLLGGRLGGSLAAGKPARAASSTGAVLDGRACSLVHHSVCLVLRWQCCLAQCAPCPVWRPGACQFCWAVPPPVGAGFSQLEQPPSLFVLMGPFQSYDATAAAGRYPRLREHFAALGRVINQYPALRVGLRQAEALGARCCGVVPLDGKPGQQEGSTGLGALPTPTQLCTSCSSSRHMPNQAPLYSAWLIVCRPAASLCWCRGLGTWARAAACLGRGCRGRWRRRCRRRCPTRCWPATPAGRAGWACRLGVQLAGALVKSMQLSWCREPGWQLQRWR